MLYLKSLYKRRKKLHLALVGDPKDHFHDFQAVVEKGRRKASIVALMRVEHPPIQRPKVLLVSRYAQSCSSLWSQLCRLPCQWLGRDQAIAAYYCFCSRILQHHDLRKIYQHRHRDGWTHQNNQRALSSRSPTSSPRQTAGRPDGFLGNDRTLPGLESGADTHGDVQYHRNYERLLVRRKGAWLQQIMDEYSQEVPYDCYGRSFHSQQM